MSHESTAVDFPPIAPALWIAASSRLLREVSRARMHDLRSSLNLATLGLELLDDEAETSSIRRAVTGADTHVTGLDVLILEATEPSVRRLPDALEWAIDATAPVAARRAMELEPPSSAAALPPMELPRGAGAIFGYALVEIYLDAARRSVCRMRPHTGDAGTGLTIEWHPATADSGPGPNAARAALEALLDGLGAVTLTNASDHRRLTLDLSSSRSHRA